MITISLGENTVSVSLALMPLAFVDVAIVVDHSTFALRHAVDPIPVITIAVLEKERSSAVLFILEPVSSVLSSKLSVLVSPVCSLAMLLVHSPHSLILVSVLKELNSEPLLAIVSPISDVSRGLCPNLSFDASILLSRLLFYPVDASVRSILLCLGI